MPFSVGITLLFVALASVGGGLIQGTTGFGYGIFVMIFFPALLPLLGGMDPKLSTPRRKEPRTAIPAGSVGIAGGQTGIYPIVSPGGWQLIGRTPLSLFDPAANPPILLAAGKRIRFVPIDAQTFETIQKGGGRL